MFIARRFRAGLAVNVISRRNLDVIDEKLNGPRRCAARRRGGTVARRSATAPAAATRRRRGRPLGGHGLHSRRSV